MTQEDKELLLKDLSARLPYGVKAKVFSYWNDEYYTQTIWGFDTEKDDVFCNVPGERCEIDLIKPYLRPISSMTEEEQKEFVGFHCVNLCPIVMDSCLTINNEVSMIDCLNVHHFDYRGLIEKGLALEATEEMYKI